ncbi:hypothetical protein ACHAPE_003105 [Trichoderma viride]
MYSPTDTRDSLKSTCLEAQIIESIEKMREEMNMSPKTSKLADKLRNQASAAIARDQDQPDDRRTLELAWNMFQILIEKSKEYTAEEEQILEKRAAEAEELQKIQEETRKLQNKLAQTEKEINTKEKALKVNLDQLQRLTCLYTNHSA